jgi:osmoprotectant transport system ATP-binding protein
MFTLTGVVKRFGAETALAGVDLAIPRSATTVLIGPSGCGKSTLLRLLNGLLAPDSGEVRFDGGPVTPANARALRRRMGYVIQEGGLFPHLTAADNAALMARHIGWDEGRVGARLAELTALVRLDGTALRRYPVELSGGQRQRVSLMRALMLDPDVLLLDEPLGALDPMIRYDLQTELRDIFRALGKTVVLVTHDLGEAAYFGDRVVLMDAGSIVQEGAARDLIERPATPFVERFITAQRGLTDVLGGNVPRETRP